LAASSLFSANPPTYSTTGIFIRILSSCNNLSFADSYLLCRLY
jgi:hypothetical protein